MARPEIPDKTLQLLEETMEGEQDLDRKIRRLLEAEYLRRLARYHHLDRTLSNKYRMSFDEFVARRIVAGKGYAWDVEADAMSWETAVSGIKTVERKLEELRAVNRA